MFSISTLLFINYLCAFLDIILIVYVMGSRDEGTKKWWKQSISLLYVVGCALIRVMEISINLHIVYVNISILLMIMFLGKSIWKYSLKYSFIMGCVFLSFKALSLVFANTLLYIQHRSELYLLPEKYQVLRLLFSEFLVVVAMLACIKLINKIPLKISGLNFITIIIPNIINMLMMILLGDKIYANTYMFINIEAVLTVLMAGFVLMAGSICNIAVLEYYLNVKLIENEKKLQISEMSLQYDYYKKLEKDMEGLRRLSHDFRNHLEILKAENASNSKVDYAESIEKALDQYESYYHTGNTFVDNILHRKKLDAIEQNTEFIVLADMKPFINVKNKDLCIIIFNAIDNALRECRLRNQEEIETESIIRLKAGQFRGFLSIVCENSIRNSQIANVQMLENGELETTKKDNKNHGYGLKNIESVVQKYGGELIFNVRDGMFCLSVIIPV